MFFNFKSRSTFTNRPSKKEKLRLKKGKNLKKKKNLHAWLAFFAGMSAPYAILRVSEISDARFL
jgi:hypothetical protein